MTISPEKRPSRLIRPLVWALTLSVLASFGLVWLSTFEDPKEQVDRVTRQKISRALEAPMERLTLPDEISISLSAGKPLPLKPTYTIDTEMQAKMEKTLAQYRPDFAAFAAIDASTGKILTLVSYSQKPNQLGHLALRSSYPAASIFKIVTAAAAIDSQKAGPDTTIAFNGGYHTLYRRNVTSLQKNRWMQEMTLREAFAKSVNTVFAKIGIFMLDSREIKQYAKRFRFNEAIASDVPISVGRFVMPPENDWAKAEVASGFNRWITISPLQGAMMAAALANDGVIMEPYLVENLTTSDGVQVYHAEPISASYAITRDSAQSLRSLMRETIAHGTSRKSFRTLVRKKGFPPVEIGGKTGSLTGTSPKGKYDWFVGYTMSARPDRRIAIAALTINEQTWKVKSSVLARTFIESYYGREKAQQRETAQIEKAEKVRLRKAK